jgi:predicted secreted hydrolase
MKAQSQISNFRCQMSNPRAASPFQSGRGQPHSKTCRNTDAHLTTRQRLGLRLSSAAFFIDETQINPAPGIPQPTRHNRNQSQILKPRAAFLALALGFWCFLGAWSLGFRASASPPAPTTPDGYRIPQPNPAFTFPRDHGSHPEFKIEWWYITGHLFTASNRRFGFEATFFRRALKPPSAHSTSQNKNAFGDDQIYLAHIALSDPKTGTFLHEERINRGGWDASAAQDDIDARNGNWSLKRTPDATSSESMRLLGSIRGRAAFDLKLSPTKPKVIFGENGLSRKGADPNASSHYITFPRLTAAGELRLDGKTEKVSGLAWMDHEISSSQLDRDQVGWDWASVQLDDGREIMVYIMRTKSGRPDPFSTLAWIGKDGRVRHYGPDKFSWTAKERWRSPTTGAEYPLDITIQAPDPATGSTTRIRLKPIMPNQELTGRIGGISYWEGACDALDEKGRPIGRAYVELTGYAGSIADRLR